MRTENAKHIGAQFPDILPKYEGFPDLIVRSTLLQGQKFGKSALPQVGGHRAKHSAPGSDSS